MDPYERLGVAPDADLDTLRSARRSLAKRLHPDHGGDAAAMRELNVAFDQAVRALRAARVPTPPPAAPEPPAPTAPAPPPSTSSRRPGRHDHQGWADHDRSTFVIHCLPVDAFELLLVAAANLGELVDDDPPYRLEAVLDDPVACWCRLELVPDAGASTVSVTVGGRPGQRRVGVEEVRDAWVSTLNELG